jgi:16S rRNA (uracil1498-N3)-methyltransferase
VDDEIALFASGPFELGADIVLGERDVHHLRVARVSDGARVGVRDGVGGVASGIVRQETKTRAIVQVDTVEHVAPPPPIHLLVPVADRERMLWLAEKAAELNVTSWRPVVWQRSRSVSPRGEGESFRDKVRARMVSALLQSRSAWLPVLLPETVPALALAQLDGAGERGVRVAMDVGGRPMLALAPLPAGPVSVAIGPEGGLEAGERAALEAAGFIPCTLGSSILRFETAALAAVAVARSMLLT